MFLHLASIPGVGRVQWHLGGHGRPVMGQRDMNCHLVLNWISGAGWVCGEREVEAGLGLWLSERCALGVLLKPRAPLLSRILRLRRGYGTGCRKGQPGIFGKGEKS